MPPLGCMTDPRHQAHPVNGSRSRSDGMVLTLIEEWDGSPQLRLSRYDLVGQRDANWRLNNEPPGNGR